MTGRLKIIAKVIKRRVLAGEDKETVLAEYPLLSEEEKALIEQEWENIIT